MTGQYDIIIRGGTVVDGTGNYLPTGTLPGRLVRGQ